MKKTIGIWVVSIRNAYHEISTRNDVKATILLVLFSLSVFWVFLSLETLMTLISNFIVGLLYNTPVAENLEIGWIGALLHVLPSLICAIVILWTLKRSYGNPRQSTVTTEEVQVEKHEGLIFLLGPYGVKRNLGQGAHERAPQDINALTKWLETNPDPQEVRTKLFATTWGPLWIAIEAHSPLLKHVWLVSTSGENGSYGECHVAKTLIMQFFSMKDSANKLSVHYDGYAIENGHDIDKVVPVINLIYWRDAPSLFVPVEEMISDFTGGTKSMTAGMILATLDENRKIQYLRQDKDLFDFKRGRPRAITNTEISANRVLVMVKTSHALVPVSLGR